MAGQPGEARRSGPAAARWSAQGRSEGGLPVNPWQSRTPVLPPEWKKGSAPGITGMTAVLSRAALSCWIVARQHDRARSRKVEPDIRGH